MTEIEAPHLIRSRIRDALRGTLTKRGDHCLNCGEPTPGAFCPACGQKNVDLRASLGELVTDVVGELFQLDSKLARTIRPFLLRPGHLTNEFNAGRRARYTSPLKLYLFASFVYFLVLSLIAPGQKDEGPQPPAGPGSAAVLSVDVPAAAVNVEVEVTPPGGPTSIGHGTLERLARASRQEAGKRSEADRALLENAPKVVFAIVPVFALLLMGLFRKPRRYYIEHLVLALHVHAFWFLALLLQPLLRGPPYNQIPILGIVVYTGLSLRRVYGEGWAKTLAKGLVLTMAYVLLLGLGLSAAVLVAVLVAP